MALTDEFDTLTLGGHGRDPIGVAGAVGIVHTDEAIDLDTERKVISR